MKKKTLRGWWSCLIKHSVSIHNELLSYSNSNHQTEINEKKWTIYFEIEKMLVFWSHSFIWRNFPSNWIYTIYSISFVIFFCFLSHNMVWMVSFHHTMKNLIFYSVEIKPKKRKTTDREKNQHRKFDDL